jgi:hypothetical protein
MAVIVRELCAEDYLQWRPLWDGYTHFYECELDESVTAFTWERRLTLIPRFFAVWRRMMERL